MSNVKEAIEEMIEESYLLSLSAEDLAREKTCLLIADRARGPEAAAAAGPEDDGSVRVSHQAFAGRVAHRKRMILKTIGDYDPQLVRLIDEQRFRANAREPRRPRLRLRRRRDWERLGLILMRLGYAATVVLIIGLIYLGLARR